MGTWRYVCSYCFARRLWLGICLRHLYLEALYHRTSPMNLRDYTFLGTTRSLCPTCRRLVDAKIIVRGERVYFRKNCPEHGVIEDFVCSDVAYYDRHEFSQLARLPRAYGTEADKGCPYDCGICTEHEQHTCIALVEITSGCN